MSNIFTIAATAPFLDTLVKAILEGNLPKAGGTPPTAEQLAGYTLLLPTRRACRACGEAFLRRTGGDAVLLPTIRPIGDGSEDESLIHESLSPLESHHSLTDLAPAISAMERHLLLTAFALQWQQGKKSLFEQDPLMSREESPAQASLIARELATLMDTAETEEVDLKDLKTLVPENFSSHWQLTLELLKIITEAYPGYLKNTDQMNAAARRNALLEKEAARLKAAPPEGPVILAGSTGSVPAAAKLMRAIAALDEGAIVLPALDQHLDEESFTALKDAHPEHPQFGLANLLASLDCARKEVAALSGEAATPADEAFLRFLSQALRPASSTDKWQSYLSALEGDGEEVSNLKTAFKNRSLSVARDAQEEAELIALILRETASHKGRTAALITPDRLLARRVAVRLEAWGIKVDDSGGRPLSKTMPGTFMDQIIEAITADFAPAPLLALLKHPLTRLGFKAGEVRLAARAVELISLRQPWLGGGLTRLKNSFEEMKARRDGNQRIHPAIARLREEEWQLAETLIERLTKAYAPLEDQARAGKPLRLTSFVNAHIEVAESLSATTADAQAGDEGRSANGTDAPPDAAPGASDDAAAEPTPMWRGAAGEQLARLLAEVIINESVAPTLTPRDYGEFYKSLIAGETVRPLTPVHPRLFIWGPFEARLQQPDVVILGGLNEGTWPATAEASPLLSRPMCEELGLPSPEQHIGYSAHDFASLLCAQTVHLTRAAKADGVETVPSRWILRLTSLLEGAGLGSILAPKAEDIPFAALAAYRDKVTPQPAITAPAPTPPVSARPRQLSVTRIEDWIANPYSIYASEILKLKPLDPIGGEPDAALRGQIIHEAMQIFSERHPEKLPEKAAKELSEIAAGIMQQYGAHPRIASFWQPRFERFAEWFSETEPARREELAALYTELGGRLEIEAPYAPFILTARADRIDKLKNGSAHIYDYKTGALPSKSEVEQRRKPQLPLEAAMLQEGGFKEAGKAEVRAIGLISARGGVPAGEELLIKEGLQQLITLSLEKLTALITAFDREETAYKALRRKRFEGQYRYDDYAHLARVEEWGSETEGEG